MATEIDMAAAEHRLLSYRVEKLEVAVGEIRDAVKSIDKSLQLLTLVEEQYRRTREQIGEVAKRLQTIEREQIAEVSKRLHVIEQELPTLKLARKWVLTVMTAGGGAVGAGILALLTK